LVQRGGAWAGCGPAQSPHRCTKCNSPPISDQCTNFISFDVALLLPLYSNGLKFYTTEKTNKWSRPFHFCRPRCMLSLDRTVAVSVRNLAVPGLERTNEARCCSRETVRRRRYARLRFADYAHLAAVRQVRHLLRPHTACFVQFPPQFSYRHSCSTSAETRDQKCFSMQLILVVGEVDMINADRVLFRIWNMGVSTNPWGSLPFSSPLPFPSPSPSALSLISP